MSPRCTTASRRTWLRMVSLLGTIAGLETMLPRLHADEAVAELLPQDEGRAAPPVVTAMAVEPQLGLLALGGDDHQIRVRSLTRGVQLNLLTGHVDWVRCLAFSPDGTKLFSAANDGQLMVWQASHTQPEVIAKHKMPFTALACNGPMNRLAAITWDGEISLFDLTTLKLISHSPGCGTDALAVAFSADGSLLAVTGGRGRVVVFDLPTSTVQLDLRPFQQRVRALAFSPDRKYLVSAGDERRIHLHSLADAQASRFVPVEGCKVFALQFVTEDEFVAAGSDGIVRLVNASAGKLLKSWQGHAGTIAALATFKQQLYTAGFDATVRQWSFADRTAEKPTRDDVRVGARPTESSGG